MNIAEIILDLHINSFHSIKAVANKNNITSNQLVLLYAIPFTGVRQTDLSHKLCIDISTLSRNLDKLIHIGLVSKTYNKIDKRQCTVNLTSDGETIYHTIMNDLLMALDDFNLDFDQLELEKAFNILLQINWFLSKNKL